MHLGREWYDRAERARRHVPVVLLAVVDATAIGDGRNTPSGATGS